jgi:hypothetical protein
LKEVSRSENRDASIDQVKEWVVERAKLLNSKIDEGWAKVDRETPEAASFCSRACLALHKIPSTKGNQHGGGTPNESYFYGIYANKLWAHNPPGISADCSDEKNLVSFMNVHELCSVRLILARINELN